MLLLQVPAISSATGFSRTASEIPFKDHLYGWCQVIFFLSFQPRLQMRYTSLEGRYLWKGFKPTYILVCFCPSRSTNLAPPLFGATIHLEVHQVIRYHAACARDGHPVDVAPWSWKNRTVFLWRSSLSSLT